MKACASDRIWHEVVCPWCQAVNWVTGGRTDRCDDSPPTSICWKCKEEFSLVDIPLSVVKASSGKETPDKGTP